MKTDPLFTITLDKLGDIKLANAAVPAPQAHHHGSTMSLGTADRARFPTLGVSAEGLASKRAPSR